MSFAASLIVCSASAVLRAPPLALRPALHGGAQHVRAVAAGPEIFDAAEAVTRISSLLADDAAVAPAAKMTEEAIRAANGELGWWGSYIKLVEDGIISLHDLLESKGISNAYGLAIFCFVLGVKVVTLPLNWNQLKSSAQMKSIQPQQTLVNEWYADNSQLKNMALGDLFENTNVNPLAGCLPSLAQIPVFLGVYYSVTSIAKSQVFTEGFLWIPNLSGPIADRRDGISWLTEGWVGGAPKFGWEDTLAYLTIPAILVCTQTAALYLLGSFDALDDKEETKSVALVLRILPLMLGWFAMNAPAGLGLYWVFNNILTTTQTAVVKKLVEQDEIKVEIEELGPRREPLPMASSEGAAPDWVKASTEMDVAAAAGAAAVAN